ncbi:MAG TPA: hypothetical protein VL092_06335 [Chitinophagaceae bacterium]|nr:hypothetical protein [Chitinophagaceae bacterium]
MADKKLQEMSNEELLKQERTLKISTGFLAGSALVMLFCGIYLMAAKEGKFNTFLVIPVSFIPIIALSAKSLKETRKEKESRGI